MKRWRTISKRSHKEVTLSSFSKVFCLVLVGFFFRYLKFFCVVLARFFGGCHCDAPFLSCHYDGPFFAIVGFFFSAITRFFLVCPCEEPFFPCPCEELLFSVIARSEATKQSRFPPEAPSDCFASLATTKGGVLARAFFLASKGLFFCRCEVLSCLSLRGAFFFL